MSLAFITRHARFRIYEKEIWIISAPERLAVALAPHKSLLRIKPDIHALEAAVARAQGRHARLLKSAGQAMGADSRLAMQELVKHGER